MTIEEPEKSARRHDPDTNWNTYAQFAPGYWVNVATSDKPDDVPQAFAMYPLKTTLGRAKAEDLDD